MSEARHNPDREIADLRQILAQGRKRIGILLGAGAPASVLVDKHSKICSTGKPLIPVVSDLTETVLSGFNGDQATAIENVRKSIDGLENVESVLSKIRSLAAVLGSNKVDNLDGKGFDSLAKQICKRIGEIVNKKLPEGQSAFTSLASWIGGTDRLHPIEVFTTNYDLLLEEAFERSRRPYFDGFTGAFEPFFDPSAVSGDALPPRWTRLWKLHGSLGWGIGSTGALVRGCGRDATELIYPDHRKYDEIQRLPYTALFERLKVFLLTPDTLLLTCGFSFADAHITSLIEECLSSNQAASVFAFQFKNLKEENSVRDLAVRRPNLSVFARDQAIINCVRADWKPGDLPSPDWGPIRHSFWSKTKKFMMGDFNVFARFLALVRTEQHPLDDTDPDGEVPLEK